MIKRDGLICRIGGVDLPGPPVARHRRHPRAGAGHARLR
jgi:hypothetical protein